MTLVTTPGAADADSYADLAFANTYHAARGSVGWEGTDEVKEAALRRATDWIDAVYHARWPGTPVNGRDQVLDWPRGNAVDYYGSEISPLTIPIEVQRATAEGALLELLTPRSLIGASGGGEGGSIIKEVVGPIAVTYSEPIEASVGTISAIENHLVPLIGANARLPAILVVQ